MVFEFDGKKYSEASAHQKEWGSRLIEELDLRGNERILDLGCGDGELTASLARLVPSGKVVGIDASSGMVDEALKKQAGNLHFFLMDINQINFTGEFDLIFSNATLHWVLDHKRLLFNLKRALRVNGVLRLNFGGDGNCANFMRVINEAMRHGKYAQYFDGFVWPWYMPSVEEYRSLMEQASFQEVHVWDENADRFFPDSKALVKWIDQPSIVPFLASVGEEDSTGFREFVISRMLEETTQADGRCFETFRRINVFARK